MNKTQSLVWYFGLIIQAQLTDNEFLKVLFVLLSIICIIIYLK